MVRCHSMRGGLLPLLTVVHKDNVELKSQMAAQTLRVVRSGREQWGCCQFDGRIRVEESKPDAGGS